MPIIHFINNKTQTAGGMRNVLAYVSRKEKTVSEDKRFVTGVNCSPETALAEMNATKNLYHKNDGQPLQASICAETGTGRKADLHH